MTVRDVRQQRLSEFVGDGVYLNNGGNGYPGDGWVRLYFGNGNPTPIMMNGTDVAVDGVLSATRVDAGISPGDIGAQPVDATLTALSGKATAADLLPYFTGEGAASTTAFTAFARTLLAGASAAAMLGTLGALATDGDGSAVTVLAAGGAVARTQAARAADVVNVLDFIPLAEHAAIRAGTSTYDCTTAFQTALNIGGAVYAPRGRYCISDTLLLATINTAFFGDGGCTRLRMTATNKDFIKIASALNTLLISSMKLEAAGVQTAGWGINLAAVEIIDCTIQNLTFQSLYSGIGSTVTDTTGGTKFINDVYIRNIEMRDMLYRGVQVQCALNWQVNNITVQLTGTSTSGSRALVVDGWCEGIYVDNVQLLKGQSAFSVENTIAGRSPTHCFFSNVSADSGSLAAVYLTSLRRCHFVNIWASSLVAGSHGIQIGSDVVGAYFHGWHALNCARHGVYVTGGDDLLFEGGDAISNSQDSSGTYHGIYFADGVSNWSVLNNSIGNSADFGSSGAVGQGYGVYVAGPTNANYTISNNRFYSNKTAPIFDGGTTISRVIAGNITGSTTAFGVGVGVLPTEAIHVRRTGANSARVLVQSESTAQFAVERYSDDATETVINCTKARGTIASPAAVQSGDTITTYQARSYDGGAYRVVGQIRCVVDGGVGSGDLPTRWETLTSTDGTAAVAVRHVVDNTGTTRPGSDNAYTLGSASYRWSTVYAATATINTSDAREKADVADCRLGLDFIQSLRPVEFRWVTGGNTVEAVLDGYDEERSVAEDGSEIVTQVPRYREVVTPRPGRRVHLGLLAQDVKSALPDGVDWAMWTQDDPSDPGSRQGLRHEHLIPPLIKAMQQLAGRVASLEAELAALKPAAE